MLFLVSGGAASGKSAYAEDIFSKLPSKNKVYLATMQIQDSESVRRVQRHREMRAGKGFVTVECPIHIERADIPAHSAVLLECLSNLTANECFGPEGMDECTVDRIFDGLSVLTAKAEHVVIVTNELFSDGIRYDDMTMAYLEILATLNARLAGKADVVAEVVCGLPVIWKGTELL